MAVNPVDVTFVTLPAITPSVVVNGVNITVGAPGSSEVNVIVTPEPELDKVHLPRLICKYDAS